MVKKRVTTASSQVTTIAIAFTIWIIDSRFKSSTTIAKLDHFLSKIPLLKAEPIKDSVIFIKEI